MTYCKPCFNAKVQALGKRAAPAGFKPALVALEVRCIIQLCYGAVCFSSVRQKRR